MSVSLMCQYCHYSLKATEMYLRKSPFETKCKNWYDFDDDDAWNVALHLSRARWIQRGHVVIVTWDGLSHVVQGTI